MTRERKKLEDLLKGASNNDPRLTETWSVVKAWEAGKVPRTAAGLLQWAIVLQRGKRRAQRLVTACDTLTGVLLVRLEAAGASNRSVARAIGVKPTTAHDMKVRGRMVDGMPPADPISSEPSS